MTYVLVSTLLLLGALFASHTALLHAVLITRDGARLAQLLKESRFGVLEGLFCESPVRHRSNEVA